MRCQRGARPVRKQARQIHLPRVEARSDARGFLDARMPAKGDVHGRSGELAVEVERRATFLEPTRAGSCDRARRVRSAGSCRPKCRESSRALAASSRPRRHPPRAWRPPRRRRSGPNRAVPLPSGARDAPPGNPPDRPVAEASGRRASSAQEQRSFVSRRIRALLRSREARRRSGVRRRAARESRHGPTGSSRREHALPSTAPSSVSVRVSARRPRRASVRPFRRRAPRARRASTERGRCRCGSRRRPSRPTRRCAAKTCRPRGPESRRHADRTDRRSSPRPHRHPEIRALRGARA